MEYARGHEALSLDMIQMYSKSSPEKATQKEVRSLAAERNCICGAGRWNPRRGGADAVFVHLLSQDFTWSVYADCPFLVQPLLLGEGVPSSLLSAASRDRRGRHGSGVV